MSTSISPAWSTSQPSWRSKNSEHDGSPRPVTLRRLCRRDEAKRRLDERRAVEAKPIPRSRSERLLQSKRRLEEELAVERTANAAYEAYRARGVMKDGRRFGGPPKPYEPPETPVGKVNVTDPDSRNVKTRAATCRLHTTHKLSPTCARS